MTRAQLKWYKGQVRYLYWSIQQDVPSVVREKVSSNNPKAVLEAYERARFDYRASRGRTVSHAYLDY